MLVCRNARDGLRPLKVMNWPSVRIDKFIGSCVPDSEGMIHASRPQHSVGHFIAGRGFIAHFTARPLPLAISPIAMSCVSVHRRPSVGAPWGILKCPTCPNRRSDDFLGGASTARPRRAQSHHAVASET
jgi:hypothetical protein